MRVLALDTSTECCSAALMLGTDDVRLRSQVTERGHAELILPMIDELLGEAGLRLVDLDGLAFGRGPGAFTGLRVAAGVVQGLAIGAGLLVAPVSSLAAVAAQVRGQGEFVEDGQASAASVSGAAASSREDIMVCNDARMGEVYWATYRMANPGEAPVELTPERVSPPDLVAIGPGVWHFAGNGIARYPQLRDRLLGDGLQFHDGLYPRADAIARLGALALAAGLGVSAELALPTYVRDDVARPSGAPVTGMS